MIRIDLPAELEARLGRDMGDLGQAAKEALLIQAYRDDKLTHHELAVALGLDRFALDALLKNRKIFEGTTTFADLEADRITLERVLGPVQDARCR
jgi:hypothetical protein